MVVANDCGRAMPAKRKTRLPRRSAEAAKALSTTGKPASISSCVRAWRGRSQRVSQSSPRFTRPSALTGSRKGPRGKRRPLPSGLEASATITSRSRARA
jgi:hypothetical protein